MSDTPSVLYARQEHGGHRVELDKGSYKVFWPNGPSVYRSARSTIRALVNQDPVVTPSLYDPHLTFDRYFKIGRWNRYEVSGVDALALFTSFPAPNVLIPQPQLGVDLVKRGHEVRKLFYAGFSRRVSRYGYDPEEVLQEVYAGILVRNNGKCPFDSSKSSFGHYVHMVCGCILSNYHRKHNRRQSAEVFGTLSAGGEEVDFAMSDMVRTPPNQEFDISISIANTALLRDIEKACPSGIDLATVHEVIPLLSLRMSKAEVTEKLKGTPKPKVLRAIDLIRQVARRFADKMI